MVVRTLRTIIKKRAIRCAAVVTLLFIFLLEQSVIASETGHKTPKDSFLSYQVTSVGGLVNEIRTNAKVDARYAKLFHLPASNLANYLKANVKLARLTRPYTHSVYCITPGGVMFTAEETMKPGDQVFELPSGKPLLRWACGNPFESYLPVNAPKTATSGIVVFTGYAPHHPKAALSASGKHLRKLLRKNILQAQQTVVSPIDKRPPTITSLPSAPAVISGPAHIIVPISGRAPLDLPLDALLAGIPELWFLEGHHGGGSNDIPEYPDYLPGGGGGQPGGSSPQHGLVTSEPPALLLDLIAAAFLALGATIGLRRQVRLSVKH